MAAHKFTKKDLKKDSFLDSTEKAIDFLQRNATAVGAGLLALVIILVGGSYWQQSQEAARVEASYMLYQGRSLIDQGQFEAAVLPLRDCVEQHGGSEFGHVARVALVNALLGAGEVESALAEAERFAAEFPGRPRAAEELALLPAAPLADAGRPGEAASVLAPLITGDLEDVVYIQRSLRRAQWLREAGQTGEAVSVLESLRDAIAAGEITERGNEVQKQLELARALQR